MAAAQLCTSRRLRAGRASRRSGTAAHVLLQLAAAAVLLSDAAHVSAGGTGWQARHTPATSTLPRPLFLATSGRGACARDSLAANAAPFATPVPPQLPLPPQLASTSQAAAAGPVVATTFGPVEGVWAGSVAKFLAVPYARECALPPPPRAAAPSTASAE